MTSRAGVADGDADCWSGDRSNASATRGKHTHDSTPADTSAAPVTGVIVCRLMPMALTVTRNGSEVACRSPAAAVCRQLRVDR